MNRLVLGTLLCGLLATAALRTANAEVFVLKNGRVAGELLNPDESPRQKYVIKTPDGVELTLDKAQVQQVLHPSAAELQYETIRAAYPDTVDGQWKLQQWCMDHKLDSQRKDHLERIIELDPDHAEARRLLGFHRVDGKWMTQREDMEARGYVFYKPAAKWMLPQEVELLEKRKEIDTAEKGWMRRIKTWRGWLETNRDQTARDELQKIADPAAVKGLKLALAEDARFKCRLLYVDALARLATGDAQEGIAASSLHDASDEVRAACLDYLRQHKSPQIIAYYVGQLKSKDNVIVNRAAVALGTLGDRSALGPLIDALITNHKFQIVTANSPPPGGMSTTFGKGPKGNSGTGMSMGDGPKYFNQNIQNQAVLDALITMTGVNYSFDSRAWHSWYAAQKSREVIDGRRGEKTQN